MTSVSEPATAPHAWQRWLMLLLAAAVIVHSVVLALWLSPQNPIRDAVGDRTLASYIDPYFRQTPLSMDPGAQYADESLQIRARIRGGDGELTETAWVDLTAEELDRHGVLGSRVHRAPRSLATNLNGGVLGLPAELRPLLGEDYGDRDLAELETALADGGASPLETRRYFASHYMAVQYATLWASARWEGTVEQVQVRVGLRRVPGYGERRTERLDDRDYEWSDLGWRKAIRGNEAAQSTFDDYVGR